MLDSFIEVSEDLNVNPNKLYEKYTEYHICGREVAYEDNETIPGYCGDVCYDNDMEKQIKEKGYLSPFIPLQISKIPPLK
jgi:hypothetical protein